MCISTIIIIIIIIIIVVIVIVTIHNNANVIKAPVPKTLSESFEYFDLPFLSQSPPSGKGHNV